MWNKYQAAGEGWKGAERLKKKQGSMGGLGGSMETLPEVNVSNHLVIEWSARKHKLESD
jgi:hypothetical protein